MAKARAVKDESDKIKPLETELPPVLKDVVWLSFDDCREEISALQKQFIVIHDLPKVNGMKAAEYMHETLELMRQRCIKLHWRMIQLQAKK